MTSDTLNSPDNKIPLKLYYVYELLDPRDNSVFYVGKGSGNRVLEHARGVQAQVNQNQDMETEKEKRILAIVNTKNEVGGSHKVIPLIVARFETEDEAFAVEAVLINYIHGHANLTNISQGRGASVIRPRRMFGEVVGIDIPASIRSVDGSFRNEKLAGLAAGDAYTFLNDLQNTLAKNFFTLRDFSEPEDRPFHPGESNGFLGVLVQIENIDFMVNFSKTCKPKLSIANTQFTRDNLKEDVINKLKPWVGVSEPINTKVDGQGRYRKFNGIEPMNNKVDAEGKIKYILGLLTKIKKSISSA